MNRKPDFCCRRTCFETVWLRTTNKDVQETMIQYYTAVIVFTAFIMVMLAVLAAQNNTLSKQMKTGVITSAAMIIVAALCEYCGVILNGDPSAPRFLHMFAKFLELSLAPVIPFVFGNAIQPIKSVCRMVIPLAVHAVLEFLSMWFGIIFYVDAINVYHHCTFYPLYNIAYFLGIAFLIFQVVRFTRHYQNQNKLSMTLIMSFLVLGIVWQVLNSATKVVWLAVAVATVMFYIYYCDILQRIDTLTQLLNRRSYDTRMKLANKRLVILMADVDSFKTVNDTFGHQYGDVCLAAVGAALKEAYGKYGLCYRIGGDEFAVILDRQLDAVEQLNTAFFRILEEKRVQDPNLPYVSVGYAAFRPADMTAAEATEKADRMMYEFKERAKAERA